MLDDIISGLDDQIGVRPDYNDELRSRNVSRFCYCGKWYWTHATNRIWTPMTKAEAILILKLAGVGTRRDEYGISEMDRTLGRIITERNVAYAGLLAGTPEGVHTVEGGAKRILVTESPAIIGPVAGEWPTLKKVVEGLFGDFESGSCQLDYLYGWLQIFMKSLRSTMDRGTDARGGMPGQAMVIAGPRDCGKSLLTSVLVEMTGGRRADPFQYMTGDTTFNGELAEAEFLVIDDQPASKDPRARQRLTTKIKEFTVTGVSRIHPKFGKPVMLRPCQRVVILANNEPENLLVLPVIEPSVSDKLVILDAAACTMPMPTGTHQEREMFWARLMSELPAFHHFLLEEYEIPADLRSGRFGITHYHDAAILEALGDLSAESRALGMIDALFTRGLLRTGRVPTRGECIEQDEAASMVDPETKCGTWTGTARDFEATMRAGFEQWEVGRLFQYGNSAGQLLGRLALEYPDRVAKGATVRGTARWEIRPPSQDTDG